MTVQWNPANAGEYRKSGFLWYLRFGSSTGSLSTPIYKKNQSSTDVMWHSNNLESCGEGHFGYQGVPTHLRERQAIQNSARFLALSSSL